jgi:peptidyl-tRNA hydrolase
MVDHNSPEEVAKRASQEDPIVMYLVVRESINMSIGKTAAQCAHSSQMLQMEYEEVKDASRALQKQISQLVENDKAGMLAEYKAMAPSISIYGEWMRGSFRKVVLRADEKEWQRLKEEIKDQPHVIVRDADLTELVPGTETVIGLWPVRKSQVSKTVKRLQVLK